MKTAVEIMIDNIRSLSALDRRRTPIEDPMDDVIVDPFGLPSVSSMLFIHRRGDLTRE